MENKNIGNRLAKLFIAVGIVFVIVTIILCYNILAVKKNVVNVTGLIENIIDPGGFDPMINVSYDVNGKRHISTLYYYAIGLKKGQQIEIYYQMDNPDVIGRRSLGIMDFSFLGIGLILIGIGSISIRARVKQKERALALIKTGERIEGEYIQTIYDASTCINGASPYYIRCQWKDQITGKTYLFKSDPILFNPITAIQEKHITTFPIYIDRNNKKRYTIVLDSLTEQVVDLT